MSACIKVVKSFLFASKFNFVLFYVRALNPEESLSDMLTHQVHVRNHPEIFLR
jgi:hypothetical protein